MKNIMTAVVLFFAIMLAGTPLLDTAASASTPDGTPFIWHTPTPQNNDLSFEPYALGSNNGAIVVDGKLTHDDSLGLPFNRVLMPARERTREVPVTGWVKDDGNHLYVAIDVSIGRHGSRLNDDASVFIKQPGGIAELRLSKASSDFCMHGSFKTHKAKRHHRVFEFKIPLKGLSVDRGNIEIAFAANESSRG